MKTRDLLSEKRLRNLEPMVAEIDVATLKTKIDQGETLKLLEVSDRADFESGHIAGAIHVRLEEIKSRATAELQLFQQIVVYCEESYSTVATNAARFLQALGFSNVLKLRGGKEAWKAANLELEGVAVAADGRISD